MTRRIKIIIGLSVVLGFTIWKVGDLAERMRLTTPPGNDPHSPLKVEFYAR